MVEFLLKRPIGVTMFTVALIVLGIIASLRLPVSLMPDIDIPEISIHYTNEDASVNEVENTITVKLRNQLQQIPHLTSIQSESKEGGGNITLKFEYGTSIDYAFIEANQKVDAVMNSLPREMQRPIIIKASTSDIPVFYINLNLKNASSDIKFLEFCEFTESVLKKRLEQLPDVAMVDISGVFLPEMYLLPDEAKLRSLNITQDQLQAAIVNNNMVAGSMTIRDGYYQYNIKFTSQLMSTQDVEDIYINIQGRLMQIKDIAEVGIRPRDKRGLFVNGDNQSLCLAVIKQSSARMSDMKENVSDMIEKFKKDYPEVEFSISRDQATLLNYSIDNLKQSLVIGILLTIFIMFFFLQDARSPLIIAISIPVSVIITILFFQFFGLSINTVSLAGLIMGVGMMVDNSIVVIDNINQYRERGYSLFNACLQGTNEIIRPLLSSVLTTCAVFVPLIFLGGISGALFYDQAVAVAIGLFVSLGVSISIVPVTFHVLFHHAKEGKVGRFVKRISLKHLDAYYTWVYEYVFHHRKLTVLIVFVIMMLGIAVTPSIPLEQMPPIEINEILIKTDWNSSIHIDESQKRINDLIRQFKPQCEEISCHIGEKQFFLNQGDNQNINEAELYIKTKDSKSLEDVIEQVESYIRKKYPDARVEKAKVENLFEQLFRDDDAPLIVYLSNNARREVPEIQKINKFVAHLNETMPGLQLNKPASQERIVIHFLPDRLALYKVNQEHLIRTLEKNISKTNIDKLNTGSHYVPIVITEDERTIREILNVSTVINTERESIPMSALTRLSTDYDYKKIVGRKEGAVVPLSIYNTGDSTQQIINSIRQEVTKADMNVHFGGTYFAGTETFWNMLMIIIIAVLMLYFILAAQFESLWLPLIILIEIPIDVAFSLLILWLCGISLNMMSMIGIVVMSGIIINDSILKIDTIIRLENQGLPLLEAIHEGGVRRLKPILMTSLTSIFSMVPLLWGNDIGSQLQRPLAVTMIAGMGFGMIVSLYFVPLCYYFIAKRKKRSVEV